MTTVLSTSNSTDQTSTEPGDRAACELRSFLGDSAYEMYRNGLIDVEWSTDGTPKVVPVEEDCGFEY